MGILASGAASLALSDTDGTMELTLIPAVAVKLARTAAWTELILFIAMCGLQLDGFADNHEMGHLDHFGYDGRV